MLDPEAIILVFNPNCRIHFQQWLSVFSTEQHYTLLHKILSRFEFNPEEVLTQALKGDPIFPEFCSQFLSLFNKTQLVTLREFHQAQIQNPAQSEQTRKQTTSTKIDENPQAANTSESTNNRITPLLKAAAAGDLTEVKRLLVTGKVDIAEKNIYGSTALLWAAYHGNLETVQWLLTEGGANIAEKDKDGITALWYAAYNGHLETVLWLWAFEHGVAFDKIQENSLDDIKGNVKDLLLQYHWLQIHQHTLKTQEDFPFFNCYVFTEDFKSLYFVLLGNLVRHKAIAILNNANYQHIYQLWLNSFSTKQNYVLLHKALQIDKLNPDDVLEQALKKGCVSPANSDNLCNSLFALLKPEQLAELREYHFSQMKKLPEPETAKATDSPTKTEENAEINQTVKTASAYSSVDLTAEVAAFQAIEAQRQQQMQSYPYHRETQESDETSLVFKDPEVELREGCISEANSSPKTTTALLSIWQNALAITDPIKDTQTFTELGGNPTLWHHVLLPALEARFLVSLEDIKYQDATPAKMAEWVDKQRQASASLIRWSLPVRTETASKPAAGIFLMHPIMGGVSEYGTLCQNINKQMLRDSQLALYIWRSPLLGFDFSEQGVFAQNTKPSYKKQLCTMEYQAELAIRGMKAVQPHGPYYLCGWSYGGVLTVEIARQLLAQGEAVEYVGLVDPQTPAQLRALEGDALRGRLLMHINFITRKILGLSEKYELLKHNAFDKTLSEIPLIEAAFELAFEKLQAFETHECYQKLQTHFHTLKANYIAIYHYHPEQYLHEEHTKLFKAIVYVAGDKADLLPKKEYRFHDFANISQTKLMEPVIKDANHFDIVEQPQFANLLSQHIQDIGELRLSNRFWLHLQKRYSTDAFQNLRFLYGDIPYPIEACDFNVSEPVDVNTVFTHDHNPHHVLIRGPAGIGKTTFGHQLVLKTFNNEHWLHKKWLFHFPLTALRAYVNGAEQGVFRTHQLIEGLLYHHYFKAHGESFDDVCVFWHYIKQTPANVVFILDAMDEVIDEPAMHEVIRSLLAQAHSTMVISRNYQFNHLRDLGFSPEMEITLAPLEEERIARFIEHYFERLNQPAQGQRFLKWCQATQDIQTFCQTPLQLTLLTSIWHMWHQDLSETHTTTLSLSAMMRLCVKNMFRRYVEHEGLIGSSELNHLGDAGLDALTAQVSQFLALCAFESFRAEGTRISAQQMQDWLTAFQAESGFFKKVLLSGFIDLFGATKYNADNTFQFKSPLVQWYFACKFLRQQLKADQMTASHATAIGHFLSMAVKRFDVKLTNEWLLEDATVQDLIPLFSLFNRHVPDFYDIPMLRLIAHALQAWYTKTGAIPIDDSSTSHCLQRLGRVLYCFTNELKYTNAYSPDKDSQKLNDYKVQIDTFKSQLQPACPDVMEMIFRHNESLFKCAYSGSEGVLHYAVKSQDAALVQHLLTLDPTMKLENDRHEDPLDIAKKNTFTPGVRLIQLHQLVQAHSELHEALIPLLSNPGVLAVIVDLKSSDWKAVYQTIKPILQNYKQQWADKLTERKEQLIQDCIQQWQDSAQIQTQVGQTIHRALGKVLETYEQANTVTDQGEMTDISMNELREHKLLKNRLIAAYFNDETLRAEVENFVKKGKDTSQDAFEHDALKVITLEKNFADNYMFLLAYSLSKYKQNQLPDKIIEIIKPLLSRLCQQCFAIEAMAQQQLQQALHQALKPYLPMATDEGNLSYFGEAKAAINCGLFSSRQPSAERTTALTTQLAVTTTVTAVTSTDELTAEEIQLNYALDLSRKNQRAAGVGEDEKEIEQWEYVDSESDSEAYSEAHETSWFGYSS